MWIFTQVKGGEGMFQNNQNMRRIRRPCSTTQVEHSFLGADSLCILSSQRLWIHCISHPQETPASCHLIKVSLQLTWPLNINGWTLEWWSFDPFESKDLWFFPGRNGCYVFPVAGFRAETSYGPKWWEKDRSQGGEKKGGGMSEPPSSPENPCMVCSSHPIIRSSLFQTSQGEDWALNLRVVGPWASWPGGNVGRFEPLASPNTGGQRHKMFF